MPRKKAVDKARPLQSAEKPLAGMVLCQSSTGFADPRRMKPGAPSIERFFLDGWETTKVNYRRFPFLFLFRAQLSKPALSEVEGCQKASK